MFVDLFRLGYLPGLLHSLWLIYEKMHAEERFGEGGFICESSSRLHNIAYTFTILSRYRQRTLRTFVLWKRLWPNQHHRTMAQPETEFIPQRVICAVLRRDCGFVFLSALVCNPFAKSGCCGKLSMVGLGLSPHPVSRNFFSAKVYLF